MVTRSKTTSVPFWQLPWVMGTGTMEQALEKAKHFTLADALPHLTQPFLIVHGGHDLAIPRRMPSRRSRPPATPSSGQNANATWCGAASLACPRTSCALTPNSADGPWRRTPLRVIGDL
jgi:hypothetical protein